MSCSDSCTNRADSTLPRRRIGDDRLVSEAVPAGLVGQARDDELHQVALLGRLMRRLETIRFQVCGAPAVRSHPLNHRGRSPLKSCRREPNSVSSSTARQRCHRRFGDISPGAGNTAEHGR